MSSLSGVDLTSGSSDVPAPILAAVIDVGTTAIRLAIGEIGPGREIRLLDRLAQAVPLGRDTFTRGIIEKRTIELCVRVLRIYRKKLTEYRIGPAQTRAIATSAVREAANRLAFLDRIYIATGFEIEAMDEAEVSRVTYHGIRPLLARPILREQKATAVVEIGGGSTEILMADGVDVQFSHTYRLGALRLRRMAESMRVPRDRLRSVLKNQINRQVRQIRQDIAPVKPQEIITLGGDMRFAINQTNGHAYGDGLWEVETRQLAELADVVTAMSDDELVRRYQISFPDAETLGPALLAYVAVAEAFGRSRLLVSDVNLRDGLLKEMAGDDAWTDDFQRQVLRSALDLAKRYEVDIDHATRTADLARSLFRQLHDEHRLPQQWELILTMAALLHEVGLFISNRAYHKHTMYLIRNSELFGIGRQEILMVALVARYHRRSSPVSTHEGYAQLPRENRVAVTKTAALLRVALALDESRSGRIEQISVERKRDRVVLTAEGVEDVSLEQLALQTGGQLFEEIFGVPAYLRGANPTMIQAETST